MFNELFTATDVIFFVVALVGVMLIGLIAGRKEETSEDYFLAGRGVRWFGVAGSIFGSNVSANHLVGMMGIGFSVGFAQSHFEFGAIFGLMVLCYGFLPVYRKLKVYTLSDYLGQRYDDRSRIAYAAIMLVIMVIVQMVPGLYIGSRTICVLMGDDAAQERVVNIEYVGQLETAELTAEEEKAVAGLKTTETKLDVAPSYYGGFIWALAIVAAAYTIFGGLKAVIWTDVIQSMLLLAAGLLVAFITFQEIGGWQAMRALDDAGANKMELYMPSNHSQLPWTGVFTGLLAMHFFYWGTNQFIVQRALAAKNDSEARMGIVAAGFLKLLIPFFAVATGIAAFYLFQQRMPERTIAPDTVFSEVVKMVIPLGYGLIGLIAAGLIGAILSSIDSMMNSAATIVTLDFYQRYFNPEATEKDLIRVGRLSIILFMVLASVMAIWIINPNSEDNFFLQIVDYQGYMTPGVLVAFLVGMFWKRATANGAFAAMVACVLISWPVQAGYDHFFGMHTTTYKLATNELPLAQARVSSLPPEMADMTYPQMQDHVEGARNELNAVNRFFGPSLNFFHRVVVVILFGIIVHVLVSLKQAPDEEKSKLTWTGLGGHDPSILGHLFREILFLIAIYALLAYFMWQGVVPSTSAGLVAVAGTMGFVVRNLMRRREELKKANAYPNGVPPNWWAEDRLWAGVLVSCAVFMHYYFY